MAIRFAASTICTSYSRTNVSEETRQSQSFVVCRSCRLSLYRRRQSKGFNHKGTKPQNNFVSLCLCVFVSLWLGLVTEFLTHHQPAHSTVHHTNPDTSKFLAQDVRAMARRVH